MFRSWRAFGIVQLQLARHYSSHKESTTDNLARFSARRRDLTVKGTFLPCLSLYSLNRDGTEMLFSTWSTANMNFRPAIRHKFHEAFFPISLTFHASAHWSIIIPTNFSSSSSLKCILKIHEAGKCIISSLCRMSYRNIGRRCGIRRKKFSFNFTAAHVERWDSKVEGSEATTKEVRLVSLRCEESCVLWRCWSFRLISWNEPPTHFKFIAAFLRISWREKIGIKQFSIVVG